MNSSTTVIKEAHELALSGFRVFPVRYNDKRPAVNAWPTVATCEAGKIDILFANGKANLGVRCGETDLGVSFFVVDIDIKNDAPGAESWAEFCTANPEVAEAAASTVMSTTPSGGWHLWFTMPEGADIRNGRPWPGVDIRGEGGYVLAPPSLFDGKGYEWVRDPWENILLEAPPALVEAVTHRDPVRSEASQIPSVPPVSSPSVSRETSDDSPLSWANEHLSTADLLARHGWQYSHNSGQDQYWVRPGKLIRDGHSAVLHPDQTLVIFTTDVPGPAWSICKTARDGSLIATPFDVYCIYEHGGNVTAAMRHIRFHEMPSALPKQSAPPLPAGELRGYPPRVQGDAVAADGPQTSTNLPDEFWEARPYLAHIRQAAWHRQCSADAVFGALITRYATIIPTMYQIPAIVMAASTFDHISVLVAESGGGKSASMSIAEELFAGPQDRKDVVWGFPTPSGEGLVSAFFEMVEEEDSSGKKRPVNKKTKTAVHFSVDEALGLVESSGRQGATIGSVLCTAWSGGNPGQGNASADRKRIGMDRWTYRMSGLAAIQLSLGYRLLEDTFVQQGLSGRLVFFAAEDPAIPHWSERPEWPGPLSLPTHPSTSMTIEYDRSIEEFILEQNHRKQTKVVHVDPIDGHLNLVQLKISGILALMDGRRTVTPSDWELAGMVLHSHLTLRNRMLAVKKQATYERSVTAATAQAHFETTKDEVKERQLVARLRDTIIAKIPEEGVAKVPLRKQVVSSKTKYRFEPALAKALEDGAIVERDGRYFSA